MLGERPTPASLLHLCLLCTFALRCSSVCSKDIIMNVWKLMNASDLTGLDCRLYTPTIDDYLKCPKSTMSCFAEEVKVLIQEWETVPYGGLELDKSLEEIALELSQSGDFECRQCELFTEERALEFLSGLNSTLQMMNAQGC